MKLQLHIPMNEGLFLRDPEVTELGRNIVRHAIILIHELGFENFTFKKLAARIGTTEAGIYRYFENKQLLLLYLVDWYWSWQQFRLGHHSAGIASPEMRLRMAIDLLATPVSPGHSVPHINEVLLYEIVVAEGAKAYLTHEVAVYNKAKLFKPYKDLCGDLAAMIRACNPRYKYPRTLASTIIEMAHSHGYYLKHLPSLTDFADSKDESRITSFLEELVFSAINRPAKRAAAAKRRKRRSPSAKRS